MQLSRIQTRVRDNVGWPSTSDLADTRINEAINYVYQHVIPAYLNWKGLQQYVYMDLASGDNGNYDFDTYLLDASGGSAIGDRVRSLEPPIFLVIDATITEILSVTYDMESFWDTFRPLTTETSNQPTNALIQARNIYIRPVPDATYVAKVLANMRPVALSAPADEPVVDWAEAIIAGATAHINGDNEEDSESKWWQKCYSFLSIEGQDEYSGPTPTMKGLW